MYSNNKANPLTVKNTAKSAIIRDPKNFPKDSSLFECLFPFLFFIIVGVDSNSDSKLKSSSSNLFNKCGPVLPFAIARSRAILKRSDFGIIILFFRCCC